MAVSAVLHTTEVDVSPGRGARCHVLIRNNSAVVDQFVFTVRGDVEEWTTVKPARVNLMPQQEVPVELTFRPPKSSEVLAGPHPFALQVASREDPGGSVVQEGVVTVEEFTSIEAGIMPVTSTARRVGKHTVAIDNLGNHQHVVEVTAEDPDAKLTFKCRPHAPSLQPGTTMFVRVKARPRKYFWKGINRVHPFQVKILVPDSSTVDVDARLDQAALIPRRFFWLLSALAALLMVLALIVIFLLRQRPVSIAGPSPSTQPSVPSTSSSARPSKSKPKPTKSTGRSRPRVEPGFGGGAGGQPGTPPGGSNGDGTGGGNGDNGRRSFTITSQAYPGAGDDPQTFSYVVPPGSSYRVQSMELRNRAEDSGQVVLRHEDRVLGSWNLAAIARAPGDEITWRPDTPPVVAPGERITLAIDCTNRRNACTPKGVFTAVVVR